MEQYFTIIIVNIIHMSLCFCYVTKEEKPWINAHQNA